MQKQEQIVKMFDNIAPTYDVANRVLSMGIDISWRKYACKQTLLKMEQDDLNIVDVACGTGDMMGMWKNIADDMDKDIHNLIGIDPSSGMLKQGQEKFPNFIFKQAFADNTGLDSDFADILSISYGIRNVVARKEALAEFNRVLKMGGYVVVLEFTKRKKAGPITRIRDFYLSSILPKIGAFISKDKEAYEYLPSSIDSFLDSESFCKELVKSGFEIIECKGFSMDISTLFIAKKVKSC
ncbi:bifunctional demethylmenaquinone methyltransferase/2-methoxy-6-polyprenyl-1,4-benzoquinol methylase UbiE [Campylobacter pinnipediorum]|uniref:bifunctional demethylmenaquinone methyltransferase/2-methoxy-6-polyprenyl-1,4-benzoquinol methylase UbiE n=1 Tax=Campylobacter pinnipediorum TaxID=1965231 RepID=UPI00084D4EBA|nr:bifunctional demethylmenaquinone methyltransferase/2-methoxy-6-polyprenyl-1,4-benzoquinol methylase UbiE [Campylobacter pinnipediorum]OPA79897.1 bifunctional demethylmenaquinone methyltransferase/2-methoxy-6-polyprenyl-1,4-benzoquinol methylase [Campylobacter pinnipediorum subsp. pinnipediorum]